MRRAVLLLGFLLLSTTARAGDPVGDCFDPLVLNEGGKPVLASVASAEPKVFFRRNASSDKACPAETEKCRSKAYLLPNDTVFLGQGQGSYVCAAFVSAKGRVTAGWLPKSAVAAKPAAPVALDDWLGTWTATEQSIRITRGKAPGTLAFDAEATFGSLDPDRVKRGTVSSGAFKAEWKPVGDSIAFTADDEKTLAIDKGDDYTCKVRLMRLGPYLVSEDNRQCGGINVSFTSVFTRKK